MLDKEFINLFTEKTVTTMLNNKDLNLLTGLGNKRLSNNIDILNKQYLVNSDDLLSLEQFDLSNIDIDKVFEDYQQSFVMPDEFRKMLLYIIIYIQEDAYSILELQDKLGVSRNTVIADIKKLNQDLTEVKVFYTRKQGYLLRGNESSIRKYAIYYLFKLYKELDVKTILIESCGLDKDTFNYWIDTTYQNLRTCQLNIMTGQLSEIITFILVTAMRKKNLPKNHLKIETQYLPIQKYIDFSSTYSLLFFESAEIEYISLLFAAVSQENVLSVTHIFQISFNKFVTMFSVLSGIDITADVDLMNRLQLHTVSMMYREKYFNFLENPLIESVVDSNEALSNVLIEAVSPIEKITGKVISKTELGYLVAIVDSYLQNRNENFSILRAIILCPNGTTSSLLLKNELLKLFPSIQFSKTSSLNSFKKINPNEYDIIFSTIPIKTQKPSYVVSNFLSNYEKQKLKKEIATQYRLPTLKIPSYKEFELLLKSYIAEEKSMDNLYDELVKIITRRTKFQKECSPVLKELLTEDTIKLNVEASDWEDAVRKSGELLLDNGAIDKSYIEAMVNSVKKYGSYIVITPHIALAHASLNDGVNKIGFSLITLKDEIKFNHEANDPVKVVITLAATDQTHHLKALSELMSLLGNEDFLRLAYDPCTTKKDMLSLISKLKEE